MRDKLVTVIMTGIIIMIILTFGFLGIIFWSEFQELQTSIEPQIFESIGNEENENTYSEESATTVSSLETDKSENEIKVPQIIENPLDQIKPEKSNQKNNNYTNVNVDKYFYNQLEDYSKVIYRAFESNKENMKTGNYQIEFGNAFSSLLKQSDGQSLLNTYYQSAIEAYIYDNPEVFYLNPNKMYLNIETTTRGKRKSYNVYISNGNQSNYFIDEFSSKEQVENAVNQIEQVKKQIVSNKTGNTYQDIKMVHDYLVDNLEYDTSISKPHIYTIYGALINKVCVCEGYARAFKYIMDELNIPCVLVMGQGTNSQGQTENHAWNYVKIDGRWFAVDATWDDPVVYGGGRVSDESKYKYFLKGSNTFNQDHIPSGQFTPDGKVFTYPIISSGDYN